MSVDRRAALGLAIFTGLGGLGAPVAATGDERPQAIIEPEDKDEDRARYQIAIDIMGEFLKTASDPFIQQTYTKMLRDPSGHIRIVDSLGYKEYDYYPGGFSYLVFPEGRNNQDQESEPWSFAIFLPDQLVDPSQTFASVQVRLNSDGGIYTGSTDSLPGINQISEEDFSRASDTFFNIPDEMRSLPLLSVPGETIFDPPTLQRSYKKYLQAVTAYGIVMLQAPHPFPPQEEQVGASPTPSPLSPNKSLI